MTVNMAVIGCGAWGRNHVRIYNELEGAKLAAVSDASKDLCRDTAAEFRTRCEPDFSKLAADRGIDAVSICTPASTHFQIAMKFIEAGKHVLVEKPMCLSSADAQKLTDAAKRQGVTLMAGQVFRFDPTIMVAKDEKKKGTFGDIYHLSLSRMGLKTPRNDCGVIFNYAVHDFDMMCDFLGERYPREVMAITTNNLGRKFEDFAMVSLKFSGGTLGYTQVSWLSPAKVRDFWIVGEKKSAYVDTMNFELAIYDSGVVQKYGSFGDFQLITRSGGVTKPFIQKWEPLKKELSHFVECIEKRKPPISGGDVGLRTVRMAEAALLSAKMKKAVQLDGEGMVI